MAHSSVKYSRLSSDEQAEPTFNFKSAFTYENDDSNFKSINNYKSTWRYTHVPIALNIGNEAYKEPEEKPAYWLTVTSTILTFLSYVFFILTIPFSYWILVKKMGEFDRLVIFRLGKMIGVRGPGRVIIFPWMDRTKRVDVRASAFAVPPQQFITIDGGIVEMGAEIQFTIVDVVAMISEVADHQDILRSLGKTLLVKILVKKTVQQLERDKRISASEIQDELNDQVRKWGIDVQCVSLSETKVLKQPENGSTTALGSILKGLGMKGESKYPTPEEFVRASHGLEVPEASASVFAEQQPDMNMSMLQLLSNGTAGAGYQGPGGLQQSNASAMPMNVILPKSFTDPTVVCNWRRCLDAILQSEFTGTIEDDACGVYKLEITNRDGEAETYYIEVSQSIRSIKSTNETGRSPDVSISISSSDLGNVLEGTLAPLQAYLTGRISATGDVRKLMFFDKLSRRGHKPGTMFNV